MGKEDQNTLENNLKAVEALRRDLSAIISVEKGTEGYWKEDHVGTRGGSCDTIIDVYIEGTPDVTKPDIETREKAKAELKQMYNSSDWYSARYAAGKALKMPKEELYSDLKTWVEKLSSEMRPPITKKVKVGEHEEYVGPVWTHDFNMKPYHRVTGELVTIDDFKDEPIEENIP